MGLTNSKSPNIKNKQKAQLIFSNFYLFDTKDLDRAKKEKYVTKELNVALAKSKKYIEFYANLEHIVPKGVKVKVTNIKFNKNNNELVAYILFNIKKGISITQYEYKKYIEDSSNGPFESVWDDAPAHISTPTIKY